MESQEDREGSLIVIEGPDASGKETQTGNIAEWLREGNYSSIEPDDERRLKSRMPGSYLSRDDKVKDSIDQGVWRLSFPTYDQTPGGRVVEAYLDGSLGSRDSLDISMIVDIYAADRKQFKYIIEEYLSLGGIIVCDRYREANLIHQLVDFSGEQWQKKLEEVKSVDSDLPDADKVFYLDISPEEAMNRMEDRDRDMHELDEEYLRKSNINGSKVARTEGWKVVDGSQEIDKVTEELRNQIREILAS
ncbi:hypothetical protein GLU64_01850 [Nanohaloarchaea archaeon]|nr:hypothetical protein [Candidatus Nanohaloarchaea archaeon]